MSVPAVSPDIARLTPDQQANLTKLRADCLQDPNSVQKRELPDRVTQTMLEALAPVEEVSASRPAEFRREFRSRMRRSRRASVVQEIAKTRGKRAIKKGNFLYEPAGYTPTHLAVFKGLANLFQEENSNKSKEELLPPNVPLIFYTKNQLLKFRGVFSGSQVGAARDALASKSFIPSPTKPFTGQTLRNFQHISKRAINENEDLPSTTLPPGVPKVFYTLEQLQLFEITAKAMLKANKAPKAESTVSEARAQEIADAFFGDFDNGSAPADPLLKAPEDVDTPPHTPVRATPPLSETAPRAAVTSPLLDDNVRRAAGDSNRGAASQVAGTPPLVEELPRTAPIDIPPAPSREAGTVQAVLNPVDGNPTTRETSTTFEVNFGTRPIKLGYALRHNSETAGINPTDLARLSGQTRLLLQEVYRFYEDRFDDDTAAFQLAVLQDITSYSIRFDTDANSFSHEPRGITLEIHDSKNRSFSQKLIGPIPGDAETEAFEVEDYLVDSKHLVETALENDKTFANNSGRTFFLKFVEAGGMIPREEKTKDITAEQENALYQKFMARAQQEAIQRQEQERIRREEERVRQAAT